MKFTKMQGLGNDYLYVYDEVPEDIEELSRKMSDRHFGAGSDGMIYITKSDIADFNMRIFNADGSEAKMCGNGIRCVGKYVYEKGYTDKRELKIETLSGIKYLKLNFCGTCVKSVTVNMGTVTVMKDKIIDTDLGEIYLTPVSVGNPHVVIFTEDIEAVELEKIGPLIETHREFPDGVNVEFVQTLGENEIRMRVWERGSGITMACGTGACASTMAAVSKGICDNDTDIRVHLDGGVLTTKVTAGDCLLMTGPAEFVYEGEIKL
ncbi:MAG: diaminopimelate epimerase [Lachnospiraceae bacterium]|nr:diaminopimelate epimerase [Lachnospiraceae bacterium]